MKYLAVMLFVSVLAIGCRSRENAAGFDQALEDIQKGVTPHNQPVSEEYREGYREVLDNMDEGLKQHQGHKSDQERAQQLHQRIPKK